MYTQGKPYHISALYLVDLRRFRQLAAGDNLRIQYEQLSRDPNSLANLDQDLPNYAQHAIPIFSLPQEWLWCESWCGNATKAKVGLVWVQGRGHGWKGGVRKARGSDVHATRYKVAL